MMMHAPIYSRRPIGMHSAPGVPAPPHLWNYSVDPMSRSFMPFPPGQAAPPDLHQISFDTPQTPQALHDIMTYSGSTPMTAPTGPSPTPMPIGTGSTVGTMASPINGSAVDPGGTAPYNSGGNVGAWNPTFSPTIDPGLGANSGANGTGLQPGQSASWQIPGIDFQSPLNPAGNTQGPSNYGPNGTGYVGGSYGSGSFTAPGTSSKVPDNALT